MYERKVGRAYGRGCLLSCGVQLVGLVLGTALVVTVLLLIDGGRVEPRGTRFTLALLMPLVFMALPLALGAAWVLRRARKLDRAFEQFGWRGRQAGAVMRSWHGDLDGREVNVWFHKGPTLEIYLACRPATRGVIHKGGPLIRAVGEALDKHAPLDPPPFELAEATFYAWDEGWMRRLFSRAAAENAVRSLLTDSARSASAVFFAPNAVRYLRRFMPLGEIRAEAVRRWLDQLENLASAVDLTGPSDAGLEPGRLEEWARSRRDKYLNRILAGVAIFGLLAFGALFVFSWLMVGQP